MIFKKPVPPAIAPWEEYSFQPEVLHEARLEYAAPTDFATGLLCIEPKLSEPGFRVKGSEDQTRGQLTEYAAEILLRQHRTFVFTVAVHRTSARLMRWTQISCIISEPISLENDKARFYEFFWRLRDATGTQLGLDPTATKLPEAVLETSGLLDAFSRFPSACRAQAYIEAALLKPLWSLYRLEVTNADDPKTMRTFIVRNLSSEHVSPVGKSSKPFIAFDEQYDVFCFLKPEDSWRAVSDEFHSELEIYGFLKGCAVTKTATVVCGGNVLNPDGSMQITGTGALQDPPGYLPLAHIRIVLKEVCIPLREYTDSLQLCKCILDGVSGESIGVISARVVLYSPVLFISSAHFEAFTKAKILHRDISDGNIMIYDDPAQPGEVVQGLLLDWDLAKFEYELTTGPVQPNRSVRERI